MYLRVVFRYYFGIMYQIRQATLQDIPLIHAMANVAFTATYRDILSAGQLEYMLDWMYSPESLHKQMAEEGHVYYIAEKEGVPAGYVSIQPEAENVYHLQKIYVLPVFQGSGLGKLLFAKAMEAIRGQHPNGSCEMRLNVNRENEKALRFYEHMGMHKLTEGDFPIGNGYFMSDYIMCMDL